MATSTSLQGWSRTRRNPGPALFASKMGGFGSTAFAGRCNHRGVKAVYISESMMIFHWAAVTRKRYICHPIVRGRPVMAIPDRGAW